MAAVTSSTTADVRRPHQGAAIDRVKLATSAVEVAAQALVIGPTVPANEYTPEYERRKTAVLQGALISLATAVIESEPAAAISRYQARLEAAYDPWRDDSQFVGRPFPQIWDVTLSGRRSIVIAWVLLRRGSVLPHTKVFIQGFQVQQGHAEAVGSAGAELDGAGLFVRQVGSQHTGEFWFIANGHYFGSTQGQSTVVLYGFDGRQFHTLYTRTLLLVRLTIEGDYVSLSYDVPKAFQRPGLDRYDHNSDRYRLTPRGMELVKAPGR